MFFLSISLGDATQNPPNRRVLFVRRGLSLGHLVSFRLCAAVLNKMFQEFTEKNNRSSGCSFLAFLSGTPHKTRLTGGFCSSGEDYHLGI